MQVMINIRVILLSFIRGSLIKPYSVYVTFFSVLCFLCSSSLIFVNVDYVVDRSFVV